jgi:hypothetical protein
MDANATLVNRPPSHIEVHAANRLLYRLFPGNIGGVERRRLARTSDLSAAHEAARILDAFDASLKVPAARKPLMQPSMRPRNLDGSFTSRRFARQAQAIGDAIRAARANGEPLGVVESEAKRDGAA